MENKTVYRTDKEAKSWRLPEAKINLDELLQVPEGFTDEHPLIVLVNLPDLKECAKFGKQHFGYTGQFPIGAARVLLRQVWHGGKQATHAATVILSGQTALATMADSIQEATASKAESPSIVEFLTFLSPIRADWSQGEIVFQWTSELQRDLYRLLPHSDHALICKRQGRGCPMPYFIAKKLPRDYCSEQCSQEAQRKSRQKYEMKRQARKKKGKRGKR